MRNLIFEITIPVLNEEETLVKKVEEVLEFYERNKLENFLLTIADNGSTDETENLGRELARKYSKVKYIRLNEKGVGLALNTSWQKSEADILGYMDLDLSTDLKHLLEVKKIFENDDVDVVTGSRLMKESNVIGRKKIRTLTSKVYNYLCRKLTKTNLTDYTCGFKFLKNNIYKELEKKINLEKGWFFTSQILIYSMYEKRNIKEIPVNWIDDPNSSINIKKLSIYYIRELLEVRSQKLWKKQ